MVVQILTVVCAHLYHLRKSMLGKLPVTRVLSVIWIRTKGDP